MFHNWHNMIQKLTGIGLILCTVAITACSVRPTEDRPLIRHPSYNAEALAQDGLAIGFVVRTQGAPALKPYERSKHAYNLAGNILSSNPGLQGKLSGYRYFSQRLGPSFSHFVSRYRLEDGLSRNALKELRNQRLERRFLLLATIQPLDEIIELPAEVEAISGSTNVDVRDYEHVRLQTIRLNEVHVRVYDTWRGQIVLDQIVRSDDKNRMFATERSGVRYRGNSFLGAIANGVSNRIAHNDIRHPPPPNKRDSLNFLWQKIAQSVPGSFAS